MEIDDFEDVTTNDFTITPELAQNPFSPESSVRMDTIQNLSLIMFAAKALPKYEPPPRQLPKHAPPPPPPPTKKEEPPQNYKFGAEHYNDGHYQTTKFTVKTEF